MKTKSEEKFDDLFYQFMFKEMKVEEMRKRQEQVRKTPMRIVNWNDIPTEEIKRKYK